MLTRAENQNTVMPKSSPINLNSTKALLQIELNEFDPAFLRRAATHLKLNNILAVLDFSYHSTTTDDEVEHQGLDPWVQWVNIHTGRPSAEHGIKRLGETQRQRETETQIWERLAKSGRRWAAWGVMNAPRGDLSGCEAFMPDPWSFEETAHPPRLNDILALPRYMARNYTEKDKAEVLKNFMRFVRSYASPAHWLTLLKFSQTATGSMAKHGTSIHTLTTLLDYLGALEFARIRRKSEPDYSVIFLNHIAHLQHQFWPKGEALHHEMELGLKVSDLIFGILLDTRREEEALIVVNGLRQKNVDGDGIHVYRQTNPARTMEALIGLSDTLGWQVEQLMTNDAHLRVDSEAHADRAEKLLRETVLSTGEPLLYVERLGPRHVFCQVSVEHAINADVTWSNSEQSGKYFDIIETVCERTGAHLQDGDLFADGIDLPPRLHNHELYHYTMDFFGESAAETSPVESALEAV